MRANWLCALWEGLLLAAALLTTGCVSLTPSLGEGGNLSYTPPQAAGGPALEQQPEPEEAQRLYRRQELREEVTGEGPWRVEEAGVAEPERQRAILTRQAVQEAMDGVWGSTAGIASALPKLAASERGLGGTNGAFGRYSLYGSQQLEWIHGALGAATTLSDAALEVGDAQMELGILRLTGPRLQAAMSGATLLAAWLDFLSLADAVLRQCPSYSVEKLFMDLERVQKMIEPSMRALSSLEPGQVAAAAEAMPELMGQLTREFQSIREAVRVATERSGQLMLAAQVVEMVTMASMMKMSLPRLPPAAPVTLGVGLVMGSNGVVMGSQVVVSAEWVEMMRRLVQAGVISAPAVGAAVRINAGQTLMAQAPQDLPKGVRDALGEGPEVGGMRETNRAGAGMAEPPQHHVLPQEHRGWFEQRGFSGEMSIDQFCIEMEEAHHQAIHGGGDWRLGRMWPGEWNQMIIKVLQRAEARAGRMLTRNAVLKLVAREMRRYNMPMNFTPWRGR
jgi:hypothetical protein